jgi:hypothetical protein
MKVTVVTASTGRKELARCIDSVGKQVGYFDIQHLIFLDGPEAIEKVEPWLSHPEGVDLIYLPYSVGKDRWNGHRMYGAGCYLAEGDYIMFLDDDNTIDDHHIQSCLNVLEKGNQWAYSLRKIVSTPSGDFLCNDDCESLGKWASVLNPSDFFVDVNCYFLPRNVAVAISPIWYCKFREPGQPEIDRKMCAALRHHFPKFDCNYQYSVNYAVASNTALSVKPDFFMQGNAEMLRRYNGDLPWQKKSVS